MHQLVVHDDVHPVVAGDRFEREAQRRDLDGDGVARHARSRTRCPSPRNPRSKNGDVFRRRETEQLLVKRERVEKGSGGVRHEVRLCAVDIDEPHACHFGHPELRPRRSRQKRDEAERQKDERWNAALAQPEGMRRQWRRDRHRLDLRRRQSYISAVTDNRPGGPNESPGRKGVVCRCASNYRLRLAESACESCALLSAD